MDGRTIRLVSRHAYMGPIVASFFSNQANLFAKPKKSIVCSPR